MDVIREYMQNISLYLIFDSFIGIILPCDKYKKYISLVSGFILILIMLAPIKKILDAGHNLKFFSAINFQNQSMRQVYEDVYKKQIKNIGENANVKIKDVEMEMKDDENSPAYLKITLAHENTALQKINKFKNTLCSFYNLSAENINFD